MKDRAFAWHAALAVLTTAAAAFAAWGPAPSGEETDDVVIVPGQPEDLNSATWRDDEYTVTVARAGEGAQLTVTKAAKGEGAVPETKSYPGAERAVELLGELLPLKVTRDLGEVPAERLKDFGLVDPPAHLLLEVPGAPRDVAVGNAAYGSGDRYASLDGKSVFLLKAATITALRNGARTLLEQRLVPREKDKVRAVQVRAGGQSREFLQRFGEDSKKAFFADPAVPDEKLEEATQWLDRVLKLRLTDVGGAVPEAPPALEIEIAGDAGPLGKVQLWRPDGATAVAVSSFFSTPVTVAKANADAVFEGMAGALGEGR